MAKEIGDRLIKLFRETLQSLVVRLGEHTPVSIFYRSDKRILEQARTELLQLADQIDFRRYYHYRRMNPAIGYRRHLLVMAHQKEGGLEVWPEKSRNLKALADLAYQLHLAERVIETDLQGNK